MFVVILTFELSVIIFASKFEYAVKLSSLQITFLFIEVKVVMKKVILVNLIIIFAKQVVFFIMMKVKPPLVFPYDKYYFNLYFHFLFLICGTVLYVLYYLLFVIDFFISLFPEAFALIFYSLSFLVRSFSENILFVPKYHYLVVEFVEVGKVASL